MMVESGQGVPDNSEAELEPSSSRSTATDEDLKASRDPLMLTAKDKPPAPRGEIVGLMVLTERSQLIDSGLDPNKRSALPRSTRSKGRPPSPSRL